MGENSTGEALRLALDHHQSGRLAQAEALYRGVLGLEPDNVDALHLLGLVTQQGGNSELALELIEKALRLQPSNTLFLSSLGEVLQDLGRPAEAERAYRRLLALRPAHAEAHKSLGDALHNLDRPEQAERSYRQALALQPDHAGAHNNLGVVLKDLGRLEEAEYSYRRALALKADFADAHLNLGNLLHDLGRFQEAERSYRRAQALKPDFAEAYNNLGVVLKDLARLEEAEDNYRRALALKTDYADAHLNLGNVLRSVGRLEEAERSYRQVLVLKPDSTPAHSSVIFTMDLMERYAIAEQQAERHRWYLQHGQKHAQTIRRHENLPDPGRKLRVGYVSADFRRHSASYVFGPVLRLHDRSAHEVTCYSDVLREDDMTARLRQTVHGWRSTLRLSDEALAEQIRRDQIDILVDLSGHTAGNRLLVFARKPAPVQVTAWGHATGTGLATMDYFLADPVLVPREQRVHFAEEIIDLPCCVCYEPPEYLPEVSPSPALGGRPFTFGCVNRLEKVSGKVMALWSRILAAMPESGLLIKDPGLGDARVHAHVLQRLAEAGIARERVRLVGHSPHAEHLKIFHDVDLGLDPYPHGGGVSTAEALWMGVPIVTLQGATPASRVSASILAAVGMRDCIARDDEEYVRMALEWAHALPRLAEVRSGLRTRLAASPFGDARRYTAAVEQAYRSMWQRWCERPRPDAQ